MGLVPAPMQMDSSLVMSSAMRNSHAHLVDDWT